MKVSKTPLTAVEARRFAACKKQISEGLQTCFDTGLALTEIRDSKLYREDFDTFADFCQQTYQLGKTHAYRLIESSEIKQAIVERSPQAAKLITNEHQARALAEVPAGQQVKLLKEMAREGEPITAESIRAKTESTFNATPVIIDRNVSPVGDKSEKRVDSIGREIPSEILPEWDRATKVASKLRACASEIKVTVERGLSDRDIIFAEITNPTVAEASGLHYTLSQITPYSLCPSCQGRLRKDCQLCRKRGWISKFLWNSPSVSAQTKAIIEKGVRK